MEGREVSRYPVLCGVSHVMAFVGVCVACPLWLLLLGKIFSLSRIETALPGAIADVSWGWNSIVFCVSLGFSSIALVYLVSERVIVRTPSIRIPGFRFPAVVAVEMLILCTITVYFLLNGISPGMYEHVGEPNPYFRTMLLTAPAVVFGLYAIVMYLIYGRAVYLVVFSVLPLLCSVLLSILATPEIWERSYGLTLNSSFPRLRTVIPGVLGAIVLASGISYAWFNKTRDQSALETGLIITSPYAWCLLALLSILYLKQFDIPVVFSPSCSRSGVAEVYILSISFAICCCIVVLQVLRYTCRVRNIG